MRNIAISTEQGKEIAQALDDILDGKLDSLTVQLYGSELVLHPVFNYYDDDTKAIKGIGVFLSDTSGG